MTTVDKQIQSADAAIYRNNELLADQRALLSQNVLSQIRNLVEGIVVRLHTRDPHTVFHSDAVEPALAFVSNKANLSLVGRFHKLIQRSSSHYTLAAPTTALTYGCPMSFQEGDGTIRTTSSSWGQAQGLITASATFVLP